jgi:hypothetical protein
MEDVRCPAKLSLVDEDVVAESNTVVQNSFPRAP